MTYNPDQHPEAVSLINREVGLPVTHQFGRAFLQCYDPDTGTPDPKSAFGHLQYHNQIGTAEANLVDLITRWKVNYVGAALDLVLNRPAPREDVDGQDNLRKAVKGCRACRMSNRRGREEMLPNESVLCSNGQIVCPEHAKGKMYLSFATFQ